MQKEALNVDLLNEAKAGDQECIKQLAHLVQLKVCAYFYRMTLNQDLSEELTQRVQVRLWDSLKQESFVFEHINQFMAWLYRSAKGELHHHYRRRQTVGMNMVKAQLETDRLYHCKDGLTHSMRLELAESITKALRLLSLEQRNIITLRFFEHLSYTEIGLVLGCSKLKARVTFHRAKKELQKHLHRRGYSKAFFLPALILFDRLTLPTLAAADIVTRTSITAATAKVGTSAICLSAVSSPPGLVLTSLFGITMTALVGWNWIASTTYPNRSEVYNAYSETEGYVQDMATGTNVTTRTWNYYPEGIDGPIFYKKAEFDFDTGTLLHAWIQNGQGNLYHDARTNTVTLLNSINHGYNTIRYYPTDTSAFFAHSLVPDYLKSHFDSESGLLAAIEDESEYMRHSPNIHIQYNQSFSESEFEVKSIPGLQIRDERDIYHRQGWLDMGIQGTLNGQNVTGVVHMPLNYDQYLMAPPRLEVVVGTQYRLYDGPQGAFLYDNGQVLLAKYPAYSFFRGLGRPWHDLNTYNSVLRDAVLFDYQVTMQQLPSGYRTQFQRLQTDQTSLNRPPEVQQADLVALDIRNIQQAQTRRVIYIIDSYHDLLDRIDIQARLQNNQTQSLGTLQFTYLDTVSSDDFGAATEMSQDNSREIEPYNGFWLFDLLD